MKIDHFIYDFDGTLSDSYPIFLKILLEIIRRHGGKTERTEAELYRLLKNRNAEGYRAVDWSDGFTVKEYTAEFSELQGVFAKEFALYDGAKELLDAVVKSGKKNYLYTHSGKVVYEIMDLMGISDYFTCVLDASQGFPSKPAPDALLSLMERFDLDPQACVMVGDRPIDVQAGANAGMQTCFFDPDGFFPDTPATYHVDRLCDIQKLI